MNIIEFFVPSEQVVCKSCGYVMGKNQLRDKCPACGVAAKMFEPYVEKISFYRRVVLFLDIHPIFVHFPQAFTFTSLVLVILCLSISGSLQSTLLATLKTLSFCLPITVAASIAAGLFDGKTRFRKVTTPILKKKICIGSLFLILSFANLFLLLCQPVSKSVLTGSLILVFLCFLCTLMLGLLGARLMNSKFPG
ncbi:MAG: hypothetical protein WC637_05410 [Victivallales bacterium]